MLLPYNPPVSALEVIEQIKALPPEEKAAVVDFVHQLESQEVPSSRTVRYASPAQAKAAGDKAVRQYEQVFQKLAH